MDLPVRMFRQAKERGGVGILLPCGGETGGCPAPLHMIHSDPCRAGAVGHALGQPLAGRVNGSFAQFNLRQKCVGPRKVQGIF